MSSTFLFLHIFWLKSKANKRKKNEQSILAYKMNKKATERTDTTQHLYNSSSPFKTQSN